MTSTDVSNPWDRHQPEHEPPEEASTSNLAQQGPSDENEEDDDDDFTYPGEGDYSTQMDQLFDGEEEEEDKEGPTLRVGDDEEVEEEDEEDEGFLYEGVDADASVGYKEQLRDVLGQDHEEDEDDDADEVLEVEKSLIYENGEGSSPLQPPVDQSLHLNDSFLDRNSDVSSLRAISPDSRVSSPDPKLYPYKLAKPFLHPTVSRLRSFTPQPSRAASNDGSVASHSRLFDGTSAPPSHFSSISRQSSVSNPQSSNTKQNGENGQDMPEKDQEVFKWTDLQAITQQIFSKASQKASSMLGAPLLGSPTVLAANGLICIGTTEGKVVVYDFNQTLLCICDSNIPGNTIGAVTALALSHDHTFVASGHSTGYIQLYNLKHPRNPVRSVPPTTLAIVATGRKEGHIHGSRIVSLGFVAGRHTALVSADDHGLAFFHSLGKVLFVDATDILRILGRYDTPDRASFSQSLKTPLVSSSVPTFSPSTTDTPLHRRRTRYTVLSMAPLPLGTAPHPTDAYQVVALLTPTKLVVVGLRPTPRTWFKCPREIDEGGSWRSRSKWIGALAWFPSVLTSSTTGEVKPTTSASTNGKKTTGVEPTDPPTAPMLAFSWGSALHVLKVMEVRIKQRVKNSKTGNSNEVDIGTVGYEMFGKWSAKDDILALQWLNFNQIIFVTRGELGVYDLRLNRLVEQVRFDGLSLNVPGAEAIVDPENDLVAHSLRVYKGKLFLLKRDKLVVGTLLTWADRILSLVDQGDFLKAIELTRLYYTEQAPGNRNNLPLDPTQRKHIIGERLQRLMEASAQYAFSDDRMTDETHMTPDGRGVDRTSLFEGMVATCCRASIALDDFEFLFEDLFQRYDDCGIASIYLRQLEPFVLDNQIRYVPPWITQRLVALHEQDERPDLVERIIWHMDPSCLDLNQAIQLCQHFNLYDALLYIYTRMDYVVPVVELLGLIRKVQRFRRSREDVRRRTGRVLDADSSMESIIMNAYKVFPYLANTLSGLAYPSEEPLPDEEAFQAKKDVYTFLFFGRSSVWPPGEGGKLVLTSDEEGGVEPTYPYARLLLLFDSEAFLHSLDIGFEDAFLNDESQPINRLIIVRIILEILSSGDLPQDDITMVNIFIARNVPKYPQFLQQSPSVLHNTLIGLADDPDTKTREDRQLAAEYLLSAYNPHDSEHIITLFMHAGFYRILRSWHYHEGRWAKLLSAYILDPDVTSLELLLKVEEVINLASRSNKGTVPDDLTSVVSESLPRLFNANISATAHLINRLIPDLHTTAISAADSDQVRYEYLRTLLAPQTIEEEDALSPRPSKPSDRVPPELRKIFFSLQCQFHPENVISTLQHLPRDSLDLDAILETCESTGALDAAIWITNWRGEPLAALDKGTTFQKQVIQKVLEAYVGDSEELDVVDAVASLQSMASISRDLCMEHSQGQAATETPLEDMWFQLLNSQITGVQLVAATLPSNKPSEAKPLDRRSEHLEDLLAAMRSLVQTTFGALVSITSTSAVSFPRLFKRLVNSAPSSTGSHYTEFRMILTGMLESYRSDEDLLFMLKHLVERDLFHAVAEITKERVHGWAAGRGVCQYCRKPLLASHNKQKAPEGVSASFQVVVSRTGAISHSHCSPPDITTSA